MCSRFPEVWPWITLYSTENSMSSQLRGWGKCFSLATLISSEYCTHWFYHVYWHVVTYITTFTCYLHVTCITHIAYYKCTYIYIHVSPETTLSMDAELCSSCAAESFPDRRKLEADPGKVRFRRRKDTTARVAQAVPVACRTAAWLASQSVEVLFEGGGSTEHRGRFILCSPIPGNGLSTTILCISEGLKEPMWGAKRSLPWLEFVQFQK